MSRYPTYLFHLLIIICAHSMSYGQGSSIFSEGEYNKVFVETDNFDSTYLEELSNRLINQEIDETYFSILNDLGYFWHTRNLDSAIAYTLLGLKLTKSTDTLWYGRLQITQGALLLRMEMLDSAEHILINAQKNVKEEDLPFLKTQLGYVYERRGQLDIAANYALESLNLAEKLGDQKALALAYSDLSNLFWKQSKFDKGLEYGLKSLQLFEDRGIKDLDYDFTLYVVGNNYLESKNYNEALNYYRRATSIGERYGFYNNLSDIYISLTDLYTLLEQYQEAEDAGTQAIHYANLLGNNNFMVMRSWLSVGKSQYEKGSYRESIRSLLKCIDVATVNFGDEYYLSQAYETLASSYAAIKQYPEAYKAQLKYNSLNSSIFTVEADQRISQLQTEFEVAQKDNTIRLQNSELQEEKTRQLFITIVAGFLLLFLLVLYKNFQTNQKKNRLLEKQNQEKEFLLKEIHHRVKNNLGVVSGLLALQSEQIDDPNVKDAMQESQNRVNSMSLIHQRLYQGENLATVEMEDYFMNLCSHVLDSFGASERINLICDTKSIEFDVDTAVPLGLIVNELLTNSLKYAFPENKRGEISIHLEELTKNNYQLTVADNGIGNEVRNVKGTGFGTQLIELLTQQIDGQIKTSSTNGTQVSLSFQTTESI